jgi:hypothetical protein
MVMATLTSPVLAADLGADPYEGACGGAGPLTFRSRRFMSNATVGVKAFC